MSTKLHPGGRRRNAAPRRARERSLWNESANPPRYGPARTYTLQPCCADVANTANWARGEWSVARKRRDGCAGQTPR